jgi:hypothetical protein
MPGAACECNVSALLYCHHLLPPSSLMRVWLCCFCCHHPVSPCVLVLYTLGPRTAGPALLYIRQLRQNTLSLYVQSIFVVLLQGCCDLASKSWKGVYSVTCLVVNDLGKG